MILLTDTEIDAMLTSIKAGMLITSDFQDEMLKGYIQEVASYLKAAGVKREIIVSPAFVCIIVRGVIDLWNFSSGEAKFSQYFQQRVTQLACGGGMNG